MAEFTDRIKLVFDAVTSDATKGVGGLKTTVGEAEGGFAKLKAGAGGALDLIKQNAGLSAAAAGGAIAKFVGDAIGHFQELALSANQFGDAVGLSVEDASRWIEVADDLGVSVETLQGATNKLNIAAGKGALKELGVGGDTTNERLIAALQHLNGIDDATERAKQGMQLFGKSWTSLAPLIEASDDLEQSLAAVSDAKVIDEAEVQKAKDLRAAMDRLSDVWDDFVLSIGGSAIETVSSFANGLGNLAEQAEALADATGGLADVSSALSLVNPLSQLQHLGGAFEAATDSSKSFGDRARGVGSELSKNIPVVGGWVSGLFGADDAQSEAEKSAEALKEAQEAQAKAAQEQADAAAEAEKALRSLSDAQLAAFNSVLGLEDAADRTTDALAEYTAKNDAAAQSAYGDAKANDEARRSMNDAEQAALAQAAAAAKLDADQQAAAGGTQSLTEKNNIMAGTLRTIAGTLAPDSPLRKHLEDYAGQIEALNTTATTTIKADTTDADKKLDGLLGTIRSIVLKPWTVKVQASTPSSSAVTSPEQDSTGVSALSAAPSAGMALASPVAAAPRSSSSAPASIVNNYITVQAQPFTSGAEIGRSIADYLDAFYRRSGTRARAAA